MRAEVPVGVTEGLRARRRRAVGPGLGLQQQVAGQHRARPQRRGRVAQVEAGDLPDRQLAVPRRLAGAHPAHHLDVPGRGLAARRAARSRHAATRPPTRGRRPGRGRRKPGGRPRAPRSPARSRAAGCARRPGQPAYWPVTVARVHSSSGSRPGGGEHRRQGHRRGAVVGVEPLVALLLGFVPVVLPPTEVVARVRQERGEEEGAQPARCHEPPEHGDTVRDVHWAPMTDLPAPRLLDRFGRVGRDLRVSVTDRCNLRCSYCMPAEGLDWLPKPEMLTDDELVRLVGRHGRPGRHPGAAHRRRAAAAAQPGRRRAADRAPSNRGRGSR